MDLTVALKFPFTDKNWITKNLILIACFVTVILIPAAMGYQIVAARRAAEGSETPLPEWKEFGTLYMEGLRVLVVQFLYTLPGILCGVAGFAVMALLGCSDNAAGLGVVFMIVALGVGFVLLLAGGFMALTSYLCLMAEPGSLEAGLNVKRVFVLLKDNLKNIFLFIVFAFIVGLIGGVLESITMGIGSIVVTPLTMLVCASLYGQLYSLAMAKHYD